MGLCKCPRRRVTPLFCFEHRVNVCESCMLSSHPKVPRAVGRLWGLWGGYGAV
uniref:Zinc finger protein-like 1 n=1 Tax=Phasianus colchicus TaxID=9054 RepID=A0A669QH51_PHACC